MSFPWNRCCNPGGEITTDGFVRPLEPFACDDHLNKYTQLLVPSSSLRQRLSVVPTKKYLCLAKPGPKKN